MIIQVTGSRFVKHDAHGEQIRRVLTWTAGSAHPVTMQDGGAPGADAVCRSAAIEFGWNWEDFPANWNHCDPGWIDPLGKVISCEPRHRLQRKYNGQWYCPTAGLRRNQLMIDRLVQASGYRVCVAFPIVERGSRGTADCLERAWRAKIPTFVWPLEPA